MQQPLVVVERPPHQRWTLFPPVDPYGDRHVAHLPVEISDDGLLARTIATVDGPATHGAGDLVTFFNRLAGDWRGWRGRRTWQALDGELAVEAGHDGRGHIALDVRLRRHHRSHDDDAWSARTTFMVEAGEQMTVLAREVQSLFASLA